ncbi:MAG: hypothetical protein CK426_04520 [Legionella sp.]|nr:MAG: hypothetical protein CK423_03770 [Legionella sp.]PJD98955.1 MAG: hypothetical protein CK426_04520 [Legionella sp.]
MHIHLETPEKNTIQSYSSNDIQINSIHYGRSLIVSRQEIISDVQIKHINEMNEPYLALLLKNNPEVIVIGHSQSGVFPSPEWASRLSQQGIGIEFMSIGAACRTYNVLLGEERAVVAGFILSA